MLYAIYEENYSTVEKKLNSIAKKCKKYGNDFVFEIKGEEIREHKKSIADKSEYYKFIIVEVDGTAKIDNWECVAVLENYNAGNIIRKINTDIDIPTKFYTTDNFCEHCNSKRYRKQLFIIHNVVTDEWKQVGGSCLLSYTNCLSMEYITAFFDGVTELEENDGVFPTVNFATYYDVKEVLGYAVELIEKIGYFNANSNLATKSLVNELLGERLDRGIYYINRRLKNAEFSVELCRNDFLKHDTENKVENIINYYLSLDDNTDFIHNVQVILKEKYVSRKNIGFLCFLPQGYNRHIQKEARRIEREAKRKEQQNDCEYFGEIGKRYKEFDVKSIERIASWYTEYGMTSVYKIVIDNGVLTWKTNNEMILNDDEEWNKIAFTVKEHKEYKGEKQTEVTRCKVTVRNKNNQ